MRKQSFHLKQKKAIKSFVIVMLSFLARTHKKIYDSQLLSVLSLEDLLGAGERRITLQAHHTLMFREKSYMESFRKEKWVNSLMKTNWVMRKKCTILTAYSGHLNTDFYPIFSLRIHISVQIPHQDGMLPLISTMPLHNLHFLLSESIYRHQHVCSNLVTTRDLRGISGKGRVPCWFAQPSSVQWPLGLWLSAFCFSCFLVLKICMVSGFPP